ncbi:peptidase S1 [Roseomonas sp. JC162]|uniref:Peptidase S1 n=1 Tax=Neoroseomonas marina TaxID=1232220 RepID=A0A848EIS5_9PROT|nr:peptidase S1 [Neoroseomonas marina]NMJ43307.1 peptidase S1 [Neoroseomonas marina]
MTRKRLLAAAAVVAALGAGGVAAQNYNMPPSFGTANLRFNFQPDPFVVNVTAGGNIPAERIGGAGCVGSIAQAPDVRLNYQAGGGLPLYIAAQSRFDVTLVVNLPNGQWVCNDDFIGTNPGMIFNQPMSGQYDIWVGHYDRGRGVPTQLIISEMPPR